MNSYKTDCPRCYLDNFYVTPHNGKSFCFNCRLFIQDGSIAPKPMVRSKNIKDIRAYYTRMAKYYHSNLGENEVNYLVSRGYTIDLIEELMIGYCPDEKNMLYDDPIAVESGIANREKRAFLGGRIVFPYMDKNGQVRDIRGRAYNNSDDEVKYLSPFGGTYFRGADIPYNAKASNHDTIVLTEGEIKAGVSELAMHSIALPGMGNWRSAFHHRENQIVIICYDNQTTGRRELFRAIQETAKHLYTPDVRIATLPLLGYDKMDIDTFVLLKGFDAYHKLLSRAVEYDQWCRIARAY